MKKHILLLAFLLMFLPASFAQAQGIVPYVFDTTMPVDGNVRTAIDNWLAVSAPSSATYYAITYAEQMGENTVVSIAGLDLTAPAEHWTLVDDSGMHALWLGSVSVYADGSVHMLSDLSGSHSGGHNAAPSLGGPGGGTDIMFPYKPGTTMMFGPNGVHSVGFAEYTDGLGMVAVDLVGGDNMGANIAPPYAYAAAAGTIDYVCSDAITGHSLAIGVNNTAGDRFIYAHLLDNASLEIDHVFARGDVIGALKYGSFSETCGTADQAANHYHLHWGITPANNTYRVGNCTLNTTTSMWTCGTTQVSANSYLSNVGGVSGTNDPTSTSPSFFDYLLVGFLNIFDRGIISVLPEHGSPSALPMVLFNAVRFILKVSFVLLKANFNMGPAMAALFIALSFRVLIGVIWLVAVIFRTIKMLPTA